MSLSEDFYHLKRIFECQLNDKDTHAIYLNTTDSITVVRTMREIEERIIAMENIVIPHNQTLATVVETDKVVRLDFWKAKQGEQKCR